MNERLRGVAEHFRMRVADAAVDDLRARYDFGCVLHDVRYGRWASMGRSPIDELGQVLRAHPSALHRQARVFEVIRPEEFGLLLEARFSDGRPMSWSHFERLATVRSRLERLTLARRIAEDGLSVRAAASIFVRRLTET
jgi:hypothetical protein